MECVGSGSFIVETRWCPKNAGIFCKSSPVVAGCSFTLIIERRGAELLAESGEAEVREAFDGFEKAIDPWLHIRVDAEILPELVRLDKRVRLRVVAVFAFKKIS